MLARKAAINATKRPAGRPGRTREAENWSLFANPETECVGL